MPNAEVEAGGSINHVFLCCPFALSPVEVAQCEANVSWVVPLFRVSTSVCKTQRVWIW